MLLKRILVDDCTSELLEGELVHCKESLEPIRSNETCLASALT